MGSLDRSAHGDRFRVAAKIGNATLSVARPTLNDEPPLAYSFGAVTRSGPEAGIR